MFRKVLLESAALKCAAVDPERDCLVEIWKVDVINDYQLRYQPVVQANLRGGVRKSLRFDLYFTSRIIAKGGRLT